MPKDCGTKVGKLYFSPRLGIAYRANEKTVFRSGFGINWDPVESGASTPHELPGSGGAEYCRADIARLGDHA